MRYFKMPLGLALIVSGVLVAIPQLLNYVVARATNYWRVDVDLFDTLTHYGGILNGSLGIPTYKEYYELGAAGFSLITTSALTAVGGYLLLQSRRAAVWVITAAASATILLHVAVAMRYSAAPQGWGVLPPVAVIAAVWFFHLTGKPPVSSVR